MIVTATEFKTNIGKYLSIVNMEDIFVTKNGKNVAVLVSPKGKTKSLTDSLYGIIEGADVTLKAYARKGGRSILKAVIDTNVILDCLLKRMPFSEDARKVIDLAEEREFTGLVNASSVTDIYYILRKAAGRERAIEAVRTLLLILDVIDVTKSDLLAAMEINMPDYEDALVAGCAKRAKAEHIVTRNEKDYISSPVPPISPNEFISRFLQIA